MPTININVTGHDIQTDGTVYFASGSHKFDRLKYTFDDDWSGYTKYASLSKDRKHFTKLALDSNGECLVENSQIGLEGDVYIGAYGEKSGGTIATTRLLRVSVEAGAVLGVIPVTPQEMDDLKSQLAGLKEDLGDLSQLETTAKTDLVSAINEAAKSGSSDSGSYIDVTNGELVIGSSSLSDIENQLASI